MEQRLAAAQGHDAGAKLGELVDTTEHIRSWDRGRVVIVLVAVPTRQVAAPDRDEMGGDRLVLEPARSRRSEPLIPITLPRWRPA
jgi:hypothetical protein